MLWCAGSGPLRSLNNRAITQSIVQTAGFKSVQPPRFVQSPHALMSTAD
jgi:hypothetical protein